MQNYFEIAEYDFYKVRRHQTFILWWDRRSEIGRVRSDGTWSPWNRTVGIWNEPRL